MEKGLRSVDSEEALRLVESGKAVLVDVRPPSNFKRGHAEGAINVPLFRPVQGDTKFDRIKRIIMAGFIMEATERDPGFVENVRKTIPRGKTIIVYCGTGGTLSDVVVPTEAQMSRTVNPKKPVKDADRAFGIESRSFKAAYELLTNGYNNRNVLHLEGGLNQYGHEGFPLEN